MSKNEQPQINAADPSWQPMLEAVPLKNTSAEEIRSGDTVKITVKRKKPAWLIPPLSWMITPRLQRRIALDPLGTRIWDLCDGKHTVENIIDAFAGQERLTFHEARVAVTEYIKSLLQRGALAMVTENDRVGADEK